jgi:hypothetical protein
MGIRAVARSENPIGLVVLGGDNVPPLIEGLGVLTLIEAILGLLSNILKSMGRISLKK